MVKIIKFLFFAQKVSSGMGALITSQIFRGLAALEHPKNGGQRGGGVHVFSFSIENEKENGKNMLNILLEIFQGFQNCVFLGG